MPPYCHDRWPTSWQFYQWPIIWAFFPLRYNPSFALALEVVIGSMSRNVAWFMLSFNASKPSSAILVLNLLPPRAPNSHYLMILAIRCMATVRSTAERVLEHGHYVFSFASSSSSLLSANPDPLFFSEVMLSWNEKRRVWSQFPNSLFPLNSSLKQGQYKKIVQLSKLGTPFWFPFVLMQKNWEIAGFFKLATAFLNSRQVTLKIMLEYYPRRLHELLVINPPLLFPCLWNALQECVMKFFSLDQWGFLLLGRSRKAGVSMSPTTSWYLNNDQDHGPNIANHG